MDHRHCYSGNLFKFAGINNSYDMKKKNKFICKCGEVYFEDDEYAKWNKWTWCKCGEKAMLEGYVRQSPQTKFIRGMDYGYNEGLGINIRDRKHYNEVVKKSGARPL